MKVISQSIVGPADRAEGTFNGGQHTFLELEPNEYQTISVKLPSGKFVTFAFIPSGNNDPEQFECVDIHTNVGPRVPRNDGGEPGHLQHLIGFTCGTDTFCTRKEDKPTTLATLLLHSKHYQNEQTRKQARALIK